MHSLVPQRYAWKLAKGLWWLATPWRMPERLQAIRERNAAEAREAAVRELLAAERDRLRVADEGGSAPAARSIDLLDDASVAAAVGVPFDVLAWPTPAAGEIDDVPTAQRFLIDLWRRRVALRARFPSGLSSGSRGPLGAWLAGEGALELGLDGPAVERLHQALDAGPADRARQALLANATLCEAMPHGLTPAGLRELFVWFMRHGIDGDTMRCEEVWWLCLDCAAHPERELATAHAFAPAWQARHPDGLTVFGQAEFGAWFARAYGVDAAWTREPRAEQGTDPAEQIRWAYRSRPAWQAAHPDALRQADRARALIDWLAAPGSPIDDAARAWCATLDRDETARRLATLGANLIGHFCYPSGLRVSVESLTKAMRSVGLATSLRDVLTDARDDPQHERFRGMEQHEVTILHTQPEPFFDQAYARAHLRPRTPRSYRIAYWYWEFDTVPEAWLAQARQVDEIWAATEFVAAGLRKRFDLPVRTLFPGLQLPPYPRRGKAYFGLPEAPFTFLFSFHMVSVMERKNPLGLIRAFKAAFGREDSVRLLLKTSFGDRHPAQLEELRAAAEGANISVIDQVLDPDEVLSLMDACDAYVSLHRSEGLGLTMAEAMLMGKPVIATGFSGNVDFMNEDNSLLVPYELVKVGRPIPPYDADLEWAEPSIEHAAKLMRRVFEQQDWARELGARGKASAEAGLSLHAAGERIARRLAEIRAATTAHCPGEGGAGGT